MQRAGVIVLGLFVAVGISALAWQRSGRVSAGLGGGAAHAGVVAGDRVVVVARVPGEVAELLADVGDVLVRGQVLVRLTDPVTTGRVAQARQELAAIEARLRSEQASLAVQQSRVPAAIKAAEASVDLALAELHRREALEEQHWQEVERLRGVEEPDDDVRVRLAEAELAHERAQQDVLVAQAALERAESDLTLVELGREEIIAHIAEVDALIVDRDRAAGAVREAEVGIKDLEVVAPMGGTVTARRTEVGAVLVPGAPVAELIDMTAVYVLVEVPEDERGSWRTGRTVHLAHDAGTASGAVTAILPEGVKVEFTDGAKLPWGSRVTASLKP